VSPARSPAGVLFVALALATSACQAPPKPVAVAEPAPVTTPQTPGRLTLDAATADKLFGPASGVVSILDVPNQMHYGQFVWNDAGVAPGAIRIRVDLGRQLISVFRGGQEIATAVILFGGNGKETPVGDFPILQKAADYHSVTYDAPMPYMLRLTTDGVAIHASNVREGWATHGCIGVPMEFARRLFAEVKLGDPVEITDS